MKHSVIGISLSTMIALLWAGTALANHSEKDCGYGDVEFSGALMSAEVEDRMDESGTVPEENNQVVGDILVGDKTSQPNDYEDAPPLPLMNEMDSPERILDRLPRDTSIDTLRGYTTAHSLPVRSKAPSPGVIAVHDPDRREEEKLFFGFLSFTIRW